MLIKVDIDKEVEINEGDFVLLTYRGSEYYELVIGTSILAAVDEPFIRHDEDNKEYSCLGLTVINDSADKNTTVSFPSGHHLLLGTDRFNKYLINNDEIYPNPDYIELQVL